MNSTKKLFCAALLVSLAASVTPVFAQPADTTQADRAVVMDDDRDNDGFDWGLLGLLGLLGLIPRKRNDVVVHRDDVNRTNTNPSDPNRR